MPFSQLSAPYDAGTSMGAFGNNLAIPAGQRALTTGDYIVVGSSATSAGTNKGTVIFTNNGYAAPSNANATSNGDKLVFYNLAGFKTAIGMSANADMFFQSNGSVSSGFYFYSSNTGTPGVVASINYQGLITTASTTLMASSVALTNGAAAATGTLLNAPAAGNPTKWIPINDNGTTRYIPAWQTMEQREISQLSIIELKALGFDIEQELKIASMNLETVKRLITEKLKQEEIKKELKE